MLAIEQLLKGGSAEDMSKSELIWLCSIMGTATIVKLALWLYCRTSGSDIVRAYAKVFSIIFVLIHICKIINHGYILNSGSLF